MNSVTVSRRARRAIVSAFALGVLAAVGYALRWRRNPSPCPYAQRGWLEAPRPTVSRARVHELVAPQSSERLLEVGPGTGYYTNDVARSLEPDGTLHAVDVQRDMAAELRSRTAAREGPIAEPIVGDAQSLPYRENSFDAAYLVLVLGEVPNPDRALGELYRVVKPGGRLVVGESLPDPHFIPLDTLRQRARRQGFTFEDVAGMRFGYVGRFSVPSSGR